MINNFSKHVINEIHYSIISIKYSKYVRKKAEKNKMNILLNSLTINNMILFTVMIRF